MRTKKRKEEDERDGKRGNLFVCSLANDRIAKIKYSNESYMYVNIDDYYKNTIPGYT